MGRYKYEPSRLLSASMQFFGQSQSRQAGLPPKSVRDFASDYADEVRKLNDYRRFFAVHDAAFAPLMEKRIMDSADRWMNDAYHIGQTTADRLAENRLTREDALSRKTYAWTLFDGKIVHKSLRDFLDDYVFLKFIVADYKLYHYMGWESISGGGMYSHASKAH